MALSFWFLLRRHAGTIRLSHNTFTNKQRNLLHKLCMLIIQKYCFILLLIPKMMKRGHFTQKLKNELLTWCYSAYFASQNGTYHRAWSPTITELYTLMLSYLRENFNYCIIRKQHFFNYLCSTRDTYPYTRIN